MKDKIKNKAEGADRDKREVIADVPFYIKGNFWRGNLNIVPTTYTNITSMLPPFYAAVLSAKKSHINKNTAQAKLTLCNNLLVKLNTTHSDLANSLNTLKDRKATIESNIKSSKILITKYEKIIKGEMKMDSWIDECKKYSGKITNLKAEIVALEAQINSINEQITAIKNQISLNNIERTKLQQRIIRLTDEQKIIVTRLEHHNRENSVLHTTLRANYKVIETLKNNRSAASSTQEELKRELKSIQERLNKISVDITKYDCEIVDMEKKIDKLKIEQQTKNDQIDVTTLSSKNVTAQIEKVNNLIKNLDKNNTQLNSNLNIQNAKISEKNKKIQNNTEFINNYTVTANTHTHAFYNTEVTKQKTIVTRNQTELDALIISIGVKEGQVIVIEGDKNTNKRCVEAESAVVSSSDSAVKAKLLDAKSIQENIKVLWSDTSSLEVILTMLETRTIDLQNWVKDTKRSIHLWADSLPDDPANIVAGDLSRKKRKL